MSRSEYPEWLKELIKSMPDLTWDQRDYLDEVYEKTQNEELVRYLAERRAQWPKARHIHEEVSLEHWEYVWEYTPDSLVEKYRQEIWQPKHSDEYFTYPPSDWFRDCIGHENF